MGKMEFEAERWGRKLGGLYIVERGGDEDKMAVKNRRIWGVVLFEVMVVFMFRFLLRILFGFVVFLKLGFVVFIVIEGYLDVNG